MTRPLVWQASEWGREQDSFQGGDTTILGILSIKAMVTSAFVERGKNFSAGKWSSVPLPWLGACLT